MFHEWHAEIVVIINFKILEETMYHVANSRSKILGTALFHEGYYCVLSALIAMSAWLKEHNYCCFTMCDNISTLFANKRKVMWNFYMDEGDNFHKELATFLVYRVSPMFHFLKSTNLLNSFHPEMDDVFLDEEKLLLGSDTYDLVISIDVACIINHIFTLVMYTHQQ